MCFINQNDLEKIFRKLDKNGDGFVSVEELNYLLERIGVQFGLEKLEPIVGKSCLDSEGFISFFNSISKINEEGEEGDLSKAFKVFDLNGDGLISSEELQHLLLKLGLWDKTSDKDCTHMISVYDTNSDGFLDYEEFKNMMLSAIS